MFPTGALMSYTPKRILSHTYALKCMIQFRTSRSTSLPPPRPPFIMPSPPVAVPLDLLGAPIPIGDGNPTRGARTLAETEARDQRAAARILSRTGRALSDLEVHNARVLKRIGRCFLARTEGPGGARPNGKRWPLAERFGTASGSESEPCPGDATGTRCRAGDSARTGSLRGGDPQASPPGARPLGARPGAGATG